jgi:hypothetical protein
MPSALAGPSENTEVYAVPITMVCDALGLDAAALAAVVRRANGRCG